MFTYTQYVPTSHYSAVEKLGDEIFEEEFAHIYRSTLRDAHPDSIVVLHKRKVVGAAILAKTRLFRYLDVLDLAYLVVIPEFQGRGIGSTLIEKVKELSPVVVLEVSYYNPDAERLYRRHGFEPWRHMYTKATGGYLMGWSKQRHELMPRLRSHQSPPMDGKAARLTTGPP